MAENESTESVFVTRFAPGHFYSPLPDLKEVKAKRAKLFDNFPRTLPGIDLREEEQCALLQDFTERYLPEMLPYTPEQQEQYRFYHQNNFFSCKDATILYCMIRHLKPRRIIEAGSGFSSAMMLDTNEHFFNGEIDISFIEPYPNRFKKLLKASDRDKVDIRQVDLQEIDLAFFEELEANDIFFVDSTHVSKIGSDVNYLLFEVLPRLKKGVYIHIHDIFYPFEYQEHWVMEGRAWNEAYILRAFLEYNVAFQLQIFNAFLLQFHKDLYEAGAWSKVPEGGSWASLWLQKVAD